jgi:archaellum component FlaC
MCSCTVPCILYFLLLASDIASAKLSGDGIPKDTDTMKVAMEKLEERFTRTMKEVADLSDEKQRLEHLVLQLQGETETIGKILSLII